ncbi:electron transport complex, rnfabcdge type, C subunit [Stomatobaculum longum]|jgi:electron transport complex, rnfABCDGE type, C subunit|uniref:Ion-translocating oxidoreductase complex subunit C n=1 Tax=Stomatobaculum longum TaxID=796942 RepID=A0AA36Y545_9FIRM|nr:electron transport complex subunit RsxC [Stomatobaculum longum]EHO17028.1 electron transport complex, rnfabcdge type, C subunit [Stomatobaculum longum]
MGLATFRGGVHPFEGKELSMDRAVTVLKPTSGEMVYPLSQHIGAPAKAIVKVGDEVLVGQKIAEAGGFISAVVVSSVSGKVKKIEPRVTAGGAKSISIVIENDGQYTAVEGLGEDRDATKLSKQEIRDIVREAGIVGLGGAGFPTNVKLTPKDESKIDYIIVNGAECEPYLTCDYRMMIEEPERLIGGLKVMLQLFENAKAVIGVENNKPKAIEKLRALVKDEPKISVEALRTKYPQGGERSLIYAVTGREINSSMLPADAGCVVDNVNTVMAIYDAVCKRTPILERVITITGDAIKEPQNFKVRTGMNYNDIIEAAGGFKADPKKILSGGPMMGQAMYTTDVPVTKNSSSLTCFLEDEVEKNPESPCIRCGRCGEVCPEFLVPVLMMKSCMNGDSAGYEKLYGMECIECGSCSYICPARRPLTQAFKQMKRRIGEERRQKAAAEKAASGKETK